MFWLTLLSLFSSIPAWADCNKAEAEKLLRLGYSKVMVSRLCHDLDLKAAVLEANSPPVTLYRGIDVSNEEFDPDYNRFSNKIYVAQTLDVPLYFAEYKGTIIVYEVPQIYVWGLNADAAWLSVDRRYMKRASARSVPRGMQSIEQFITQLGQIDADAIQSLLSSRGYSSKRYDFNNFWNDFGIEQDKFLKFQNYRTCSELMAQAK